MTLPLDRHNPQHLQNRQPSTVHCPVSLLVAGHYHARPHHRQAPQSTFCSARWTFLSHVFHVISLEILTPTILRFGNAAKRSLPKTWTICYLLWLSSFPGYALRTRDAELASGKQSSQRTWTDLLRWRQGLICLEGACDSSHVYTTQD